LFGLNIFLTFRREAGLNQVMNFTCAAHENRHIEKWIAALQHGTQS